MAEYRSRRPLPFPTAPLPSDRDPASKKDEADAPEDAATMASRRQWQRSTFTIRATLVLDSLDYPPINGVTENVSLNGVKFQSARAIPPLPVGIDGAFTVALGDGPMTFRCRVVRSDGPNVFLNLLGKEAVFGQAITVEVFRSIKKSPNSDQT
ncbi:MAG: PilZ domain-containing protein [Magnetococcales bacterium]|nr:PilZ domain-containing protein [Magnetococcales bacterium]